MSSGFRAVSNVLIAPMVNDQCQHFVKLIIHQSIIRFPMEIWNLNLIFFFIRHVLPVYRVIGTEKLTAQKGNNINNRIKQ